MVSQYPSENRLPEYLNNLQSLVFDPLKLTIHDVHLEKESIEYKACHFKCKQKKIIFRRAKVTPKKVGQFVTLWKRNTNGPIQPYTTKDPIDLCIIELIDKNKIGYFFFDKHVLDENGILAGKYKGKLGFRIYPKWMKPENKQALATQRWQMPHFYEPELRYTENSIQSFRVLEIFFTNQ